MLDFRNTNSIWASVFVETLHRLGLAIAILSPGSRSTPLTFAFARHPQIEAVPVLDERSASFLALGAAKRSGIPVVLVCTSGTAAANFFPAIVEARESRTPLLACTSDRPAELRHCHAGQAIDQTKMYGTYPNWQAEVGEPSLALPRLAYLRQLTVRAWRRSLLPVPGVVHLNFPFRDPLPPLSQTEATALAARFPSHFFDDLSNPIFNPIVSPKMAARPMVSSASVAGRTEQNNDRCLVSLLDGWQSCQRGIIVAGTVNSFDPQAHCRAIASLAEFLGWPVFADVLSPVRNFAAIAPHLVATYDLLLRSPSIAQTLSPEAIVQIGALPTSKELRSWLGETDLRRWILDDSIEDLDPLHGRTVHLSFAVEELAAMLSQIEHFDRVSTDESNAKQCKAEYLEAWQNLEQSAWETIDREMKAMQAIAEPKIAWLLPQFLPPKTPVWIANSMPVRDAEFFWRPNDRALQPFFNRGANGIDGTLSSALGAAWGNRASVLLTGDLALLHDTNGFLLRSHFRGHLTIILINNNGGGIFEMLPISAFEPPFEEYFATPQNVNFASLCAAYGIEHHGVRNWQDLQNKLSVLPERGIRVLEIQTDRKADTRWRQEFFREIAAELAIAFALMLPLLRELGG